MVVAPADLLKENYPDDWSDLDTLAVNTARILAADAVQKVGNGHPGTAMSLAPIAYSLFQRIMKHNPKDPNWEGRDRFILSCGHSSLTLYIQLFLAGYGLELSDLEALRTAGSLTPGHPEYRHTAGVEMTTGPLGQGLASSTGMSMASLKEKTLFSPDGTAGDLFDHFIYVLASDGDIEEGVTSESGSLAGTQQLGNLIAIYDLNHISIEGDTGIALTEDTAKRYEAYGWQVLKVVGGNNMVDFEKAIKQAQEETTKPSLIIVETVIAYPAPNLMNNSKSHGAALGEDEIKLTKEKLGFDPNESFEIPVGVLEHTRKAQTRGEELEKNWQEKLSSWAQQNPQEYDLYKRIQGAKLPTDLWNDLPQWDITDKPVATRNASETIINYIASRMPEFWGGSADLAGSNNTTIKGAESFGPSNISTEDWKVSRSGRVLHFGIREHTMGSIMNGITLHGNTRVFGGTFLVFSDYVRPPVRLSALMQLPVTYVWTHDSIGLGEDGPTHQPIEQLPSLRAVPNLNIVRPADANETAYAWETIMKNTSSPAGLILSRQGLPILANTSLAGVERGGYIIKSEENPLKTVILATGSEVQLGVEAAKTLEKQGIGTRVVSLPCLEWFDAQDKSYRDSVIPNDEKIFKLAVEAAHPQSWYKYVGSYGKIIGIDHFGESAAGPLLFEKFGFTATNIVKTITENL